MPHSNLLNSAEGYPNKKPFTCYVILTIGFSANTSIQAYNLRTTLIIMIYICFGCHWFLYNDHIFNEALIEIAFYFTYLNEQYSLMNIISETTADSI